MRLRENHRAARREKLTGGREDGIHQGPPHADPKRQEAAL
jgi:hypothetical protein